MVIKYIIGKESFILVPLQADSLIKKGGRTDWKCLVSPVKKSNSYESHRMCISTILFIGSLCSLLMKDKVVFH